MSEKQTSILAREVAPILKCYDDQSSALIPILHFLQEKHGHLNEKIISQTATLLELELTQVKEVVSFYPQFRTTSRGKESIYVCTHLNCSLYGGQEIYEGLIKKLKQKEGVSSDGKFSVVGVDCLGRCDQAPCMRVGKHKCIGKLTLEEALENLRGQA